MVEAISEPNQLLADLTTHPGWNELRRVAKERMEGHFKELSREFASKDNRPDYETLQFQRGVFAGMKHLLDHPDLEAKRLKRLLEKEVTSVA